MRRIGSYSLGDLPLPVVRIDCKDAVALGVIGSTGWSSASAPTPPCPTCSWRWRHASAGRTPLGHAARSSRIWQLGRKPNLLPLLTAEIAAKRLVEHLERAGFVVMKRPAIGGASALGRGHDGR